MTIKSTTQYDFSGNIVMFSRTGLFPQTDKYEYDKNNRVIKKETTYIGEGNYDKGEIHHETIIFDRDEYGSVIKETTFYENEDKSILKEPEETKIFQYKYDTHGNIIYEKDEGHEYKYEITYY